MFAVRDSVEPEDRSEGYDAFPESPAPPLPHATPITFDLPSTTSGPTETSSTSNPTQKAKTPIINDPRNLKRPRSVGVDGVIDLAEDIWNFPVETPARPAHTRNTRSRGRESTAEETPPTKRVSRRHSITTIDDGSVRRSTRRSSCLIDDESPIISRRRRAVQDDDECELESPVSRRMTAVEQTTPMSLKWSHPSESREVENTVKFESPRRLVVAVEITSRPRRNLRSKIPLEEIVAENIPASEPSPIKSVANIKERPPPPEIPPESKSACSDIHDVVDRVSNVAASSPPQLMQEQPLKEVVLSPPRYKNVASILAKSPHRPLYRVGLSRRVNIESLHGYLKKGAS